MKKAVADFFAHWEVYRLCIEHNTLHHREVESALRIEMTGAPAGFRFLDLAAGDAWTTSRVLAGKPVNFYRAVDFSAEALDYARRNTEQLGCRRDFCLEDFRTYLRAEVEQFDFVYLGLSLHHLQLDAKKEVMLNIHRAVAPGGFFFLYEPILDGGERREACLSRWKANMDRTWTGFPEKAKAAIWEHVESSDFPESFATWTEMAEAAGFRDPVELFRDTGIFYSLMRFRA